MEVDEESKWLLHHSDWLCRILQLIISIVYLIACWYTSVDLVFRADSLNSPIIGTWVVAILMDILASLNTVQLDKGRGSCCTRLKILMEYLKKQAYLDIGMVVYVSVAWRKIDEPVHSGAHLVVLILLAIKLSRKSELLRTYFDLKKYMVMVDSFLLLLVVGHISVRIITK